MTLILPHIDPDIGRVPDQIKKGLEEIYSLGALDLSSDERFGRYTELATDVLGAPFVSAVLVDKDRLVTKGVGGSIGREIDRDASFAVHAMSERGLLIVEDALRDPRFANHPLVRGNPRIRFYAGVAIRAPGGEALGALGVMDTVTRALGAREQSILAKIGKLLEHEFQCRASVDEIRQRLRNQVLLDASTRLPTEALFTARLARLLQKHPRTPTMLALVRLERFESIFSAVGRPGAACLIKSAADRLKSAINRKCLIGKTREDTIALALRPAHPTRPELEIQRMLDAFEFPFLLGDHTLSQAVSIGVAIHPRDGQDSDTLLKRARTALNAVAVADPTRFRRYHRSLSHEAARQFEIETALRGAIDRDELTLVYQPKIEIASGRLAGAEALLRWTNPALGSIGPNEFIPIAEDSGLIIQVGDWALAAACMQMADWLAQGMDCPQISVNVSGVQLRDRRFTRRVRGLLARHSLAGSKLNLEITEGTLIESIEDAISIMSELCSLGVDFSIDDFGKGFSSLSYLARMPVQALKIDKSFVDQIPDDRTSMTLISSMTAMAHGLDIEVVAEGVESEEQLNALRAAGCDQVQGFLFSPPRSAPEFAIEYLKPPQSGD